MSFVESAIPSSVSCIVSLTAEQPFAAGRFSESLL